MRSVACLPQQQTSNRASPQASHPWLPGWSALITMQGLPSPSAISYQPFALNILIIWLNCNALGLACELPCIHRAAWLYIAAYLLQRTCAADQKHACICMPGEYVLANDWGPFSAPFVVAKLHGNLPAHHVCKLEAMTMTDVQRQLSWPWPHNRDEHITYGSEIVIGRARRRCIEKNIHLHSQWICLTLTKCRDHVIGLLLISDLYLPADQIFAICLNRFGNGNSSFLSPYQKGSNADLWTQVKIDCRCVHAW